MPKDAAAVQEELLRDPAVQKAIQEAGEKALKDERVQKVLLETAKKKGGEFLNVAPGMVKQWATDPAVQAKAKHYAGVALNMVATAGENVVGCIEQGPTGVRVLAFVGGIGSLCLSALHLINPGNIIMLFSYAVAVYQAIFALTTMLFEVKPEWVEKVTWLGEYQDILVRECRFITLVGGRGLFYIFQGSLWIVFCQNLVAEIAELVVGLYLCLIGALHVLMHFGIMPQHIAAKARGYHALAAQAVAPAPQA